MEQRMDLPAILIFVIYTDDKKTHNFRNIKNLINNLMESTAEAANYFVPGRWVLPMSFTKIFCLSYQCP
jgi:hypothetical protein